ncbi:hypothetical protein GDO86_003324 [Hymenochirus boettgeri]|uniref:UHRF1 binding protein 1 n=1 Tax=Hymenochirus boettgeri TaxID=247094 RepID=A0A8T2K6J9_9PIPI|nr:hypothetical protein GDO86_003324 [Hymenochirus boettgeri]
MAGIIKRQILKHLSRFTKNLTPEQINLSSLRGEGQLTDLQLDEEAIQNMLDLPTWLAITRVYCNRAAIRIQWTKLKTHPICLMLDKVEVEMETCENPRPPNGPSPIALAAGQSEYGFAEKVVEGMYLEVGCVSIKIESRTFRASLQLWQLQGYSVNPNWQQSDLRFTRLTHPQRGEVLTFKEVKWQTLRVEADASEDSEDAPSTPLRLITNGGCLHVALKRRMKDCLVLSSKISLLLDDLLWVLTDSQLRALLSYTKSLSEAVQKSVRQRKEGTEDQAASSPTTPPQQPLSDTPSPPTTTTSLGQYFDKYDVKETSYHLVISRLDLHVCDESSFQRTSTVSGGAIQLTLRQITLDYYPAHRAGQSCSHWHRVSPAMGTFEQWAQDLAEEREAAEVQNMNVPGKESPLKPKKQSTFLPPLYYFSLLIRVDVLDIYQVSSSGQAAQKPSLLSCGRIPYTCSAIHFQYTEYYSLPGKSISVPSPAIYIQLHGLLFSFATSSILWLNQFMLDLSHHLQQFTAAKSGKSEKARDHKDVRLDGFNLKLNFPVATPQCPITERSQSICAHVALVTLTNTRQAPGSTLQLLQQAFRLFASKSTFHWPPGPLHPVFLAHAYPSSVLPSTSLWSLHSPSLSMYFEGAPPKQQILLHSFPFTAWACLLHSERELHVLLNVEDFARIQLDHYQYVIFLRAQEQLKNLLEELQNMVPLSLDQNLKVLPPCPMAVCVGLLIPEVSMSLLLPPSFSLENPSQTGESDQSSLIGSEVENGSELEKKKVFPIVQKALNAQGEMDVCEESLNATAVQHVKQVQEDDVHIVNKVSSESLHEKQVVIGAIQKMEQTQGIFQGREMARDVLLSTIGRTRETLNSGKERMQRLLRDTKQKDSDSLLSRTESQQSFDRFSLEGMDVVSFDSESSDGFLLLLGTDILTGMNQTEEDIGTEGDNLTDPENASQCTEEPEPQQILTVSLTDVVSVSHMQEDNISVSLQAAKMSCGSRTEESPLEINSSASVVSKPHFCMEFNIGPDAATLSPLAKQNGFLQLWIKHFTSELPISSITHLGPFFEDEQIPDILPMTIHISNSHLTLKDNGPRLYPSPLVPQPVHLTVKNIKIERKEDGIFYLAADGENASHMDNLDTSDKLPQSKQELQRQLTAAWIKLEEQNQMQQRLLQEIRKYNPGFKI